MLLCFPEPRADLHLVATRELELRLGVRLGVQVALVNTLRQRTHAQALRRLDVLIPALHWLREPRRAQFCIRPAQAFSHLPPNLCTLTERDLPPSISANLFRFWGKGL